jgi:diaminohydroxyphosphoribosylaminopyrimidine deaminase / 5-amino-6-(5-phosphoribosylamino)uracil reductase
MAQALRLAGNGLYTTTPNPRVGCVIVNKDEIVGQGWHVQAGADHAEIIALKQAGDRARGATCYVTLEPCIHTGKTPPCTPALLGAGISRVVTAMIDPNPRVAGKGLQHLATAGVLAANGLMEKAARALNPGFIKRMTKGLPYVRCKLAISVDGKTALNNGSSKWITSEAARKDAQQLRAQSCAIMTGIGTVLADDPLLTVRDIDTLSRQPLRVIIDRQLRLPLSAKLLDQSGKVLLLTTCQDQDKQRPLQDRGVQVHMPESTDFLQNCLRYLAEHHEINELLVEAGPGLTGSLIRAGLVDELVVYQAPILLGDKAMSMLTLPEFTDMNDGIRMTLTDSRAVGTDMRFRYQFCED